jgi:alpha-1,2-mannosyltransferase
MSYRARHARPALPVSSQVRAGRVLHGAPHSARAGARAPDEPPRGRSVPAGAPVSDEPPRGRSFWARRARTAFACRPLALRRHGTVTIAAQPSPPPTPVRQGSPRLDRIGTPLLALGAATFAAALARFGLHMAGQSFLTRMSDLSSFRDAGLIVRHAYHFRAGQPKPLYQWIPPGGASPFIYPPFAAAIFAALSYIGLPALAWSVTAASFAALLTAVGLTLAGLGVPKGRARIGAALAVSAVALWAQPVESNLGLGQINLLLTAMIIWDLRPRGGSHQAAEIRTQASGGDHAAASPWWTGALTGVAAGIKLTPLIFIPYLLVTRKFRQAAVAAGVFAATLGLGFAVMPGASATYWRSGLIDRLNGTNHPDAGFFFAAAWNQSLRGYLSRLVPHAPLAVIPWLIAAGLTAVLGLACAAVLHRYGYPMLGLLTCALTGLLISPVSWVHQWVWVAPWLAAIVGTALLAPGASRRVWLALAGWITLVFVDWPPLPVLTGTSHGMNVIADVPVRQPFSWRGPQVFAGNIYLYCGAAGLAALYLWAVFQALRHSDLPSVIRQLATTRWPARDVEIIPRMMSDRE